MIVTKDGIINVFHGNVDFKTAESLAKKYNFYIDEFREITEDGSPKTLIMGREMEDERFIKTISYRMSPELNELLTEICDFSILPEVVKNYFAGQGLTPLSRRTMPERDLCRVYKEHRNAISEICLWDSVFSGTDSYEDSTRHLERVLGL